jgi:hypothetical protein
MLRARPNGQHDLSRGVLTLSQSSLVYKDNRDMMVAALFALLTGTLFIFTRSKNSRAIARPSASVTEVRFGLSRRLDLISCFVDIPIFSNEVRPGKKIADGESIRPDVGHGRL